MKSVMDPRQFATQRVANGKSKKEAAHVTEICGIEALSKFAGHDNSLLLLPRSLRNATQQSTRMALLQFELGRFILHSLFRGSPF